MTTRKGSVDKGHETYGVLGPLYAAHPNLYLLQNSSSSTYGTYGSDYTTIVVLKDLMCPGRAKIVR